MSKLSQVLFYSKDVKSMQKTKLGTEHIMVPVDSLFIFHRQLEYPGAERLIKHCFHYHIYLILKDDELLGAIALAYGTSMPTVVYCEQVDAGDMKSE